jgi:peptide/nickel transport system substrate-binding protein
MARGSTVVMAVPDVEAVKPDQWNLDFLTFLPLAKLNARGELEGHLARSWEHSPDHREYTFHLRPNLRWDDGVPVTAHDVKFTLDLLGHPDVAEYSGIAATVLDDSTVRIRARRPDYLDDISYFPRHRLQALEPKRFWQWDFWTHPVGNGPFRFVRYVPQMLMEFEANPDYYGGKPRIERLVLKFVGDAGLTELLAGNVDIAEASLTQIPRIATDPRFRVYHSAWAGARAIYWKADHPLFADPRVRRALTLAIDRRELSQLLNLPGDLAITDGVFTDRQFRRGEWSEPLPHDPDEARALLEAAGWGDRDGDGIRERDGRVFQFTATVSSLHGMPQLAVSVQAQLRQVGVQMRIQRFEGSMWEKLRAGDFEAWMNVHQSGADAVRRDFGRGNPLGYSNEEVFDLIDRLTATADPQDQDRLYAQLTQIFRTEQPFARLLPFTRSWFVHRRLRGLSTPFQASPDTYLESLWVEPRE